MECNFNLLCYEFFLFQNYDYFFKKFKQLKIIIFKTFLL
jgi:hypothetical protein